jgi:hypothetical protein
MVSVLEIGPKVRAFKPGRGQWIFKGDNNTQHALLQRGSNVIACKKHLGSMNKTTSQGQIHFLRPFLLLATR